MDVEQLRDQIAANPSIKGTDMLAGAYFGALLALALAGLEDDARALKAAVDAAPKAGKRK